MDSTIQTEPTTELYASMQDAYDYFNKVLFDNSLPKVIFTTQRKKNVMGYFSRERWVSLDGGLCHEIAINPSYVARSSLIELLQTLVHEMTHCWQYDQGKAGRRGYHNKEWADKMENLGLMPSSTGRKGGNKTGDRMNDYPVPEGLFIKQCSSLIENGFNLPWIDRLTIRESEDIILTPELEALGLSEEVVIILTSNNDNSKQLLLPQSKLPKGRIKSRYSCPDCNLNVWGKPELSLSCNDCSEVLIEQGDE